MVITAKQKSIISTAIAVLAGASILWVNCQPEKPIGTLDEMDLGLSPRQREMKKWAEAHQALVMEHDWNRASEGPRCEELVVWAPGARPLPTLIAEAQAGVIKSWTTGEILKATDLNTNFSHIHDNMVGGHGARLLDADVSSGAAISHTKLATPALVAKAWGAVVTACNGAAAVNTACTLDDSSGVTAVKADNTQGQYCVDLSYSPPNANFNVQVTSLTTLIVCQAQTLNAGAGAATAAGCTNSNFIIKCLDPFVASPGVPGGNVSFAFAVFDT